MTSIIGYARGSTREQDPQAQEAELRGAGATRVFIDHGESSRTTSRPQWAACLDYLREGDTLIVRALDRVAGTEQMAIEIIRDLDHRGIRLKSLTEPFLDVDTCPRSHRRQTHSDDDPAVRDRPADAHRGEISPENR